MAKVHKAHKSKKKYSFQKKKISMKTLLIILAVVVVAAIGLKIAYDNYLTGEFEVAAPTSERLNNIADNWEILNTHTDKFMNYYELLGYTTDSTDGAGNVMLLYYGNEDVTEVSIQVLDINNNDETTEPSAVGYFGRTSLTNFINGVAPWGQLATQVIAQNGNLAISVYDEDAEKMDAEVLDAILAEIEAVIAQGPVVVEETVEETAETTETTEEVPAE